MVQDMNFWLLQRIRKRVAKQVSYPPLLEEFRTTQTVSACPKRHTNPISMSSKVLKKYRWFRRNQICSGPCSIQVVSVFRYS